MHLGNTAHRELTRSVKLAREISGLTFGVYIGELTQGRDSAIARHAELAAAESAVLIAVDPDARTIDIVTGIEAHIFLDDRSCDLPRRAIVNKGCWFLQGRVRGCIVERRPWIANP